MVETNNAESLLEGGEIAQEDAIPADEYEKLLDAYNSNITEGEVVKGKVLQVSDSEVVVDVGYKSEGMIKRQRVPERER